MTKPLDSYLDSITYPSDLRKLSEGNLPCVAQELRDDMIRSVSQTGGHLGAGLGVVELTIALHYVFNTPDDKIIWDVGHQAYPHKILTGRRDQMLTIRQKDGLSGFTRRAESPYDPFGAGHSSTSISAGLGMAVAHQMSGQARHVISVIGDGSMSAGMAFEALNNLGSLKTPMLIVLNDNEMSIAPPVGAMSTYLSKLLSSRTYHSMRDVAKKVLQSFPDSLGKMVHKAEEFTKGMVSDKTIFDQLGVYYIGPIDGHDFDQLLPILQNIKQLQEKRPVLLHVVTQKGKGYEPAEKSGDKYHGVSKFDIETGKQHKEVVSMPSFTNVFADTLIDIASHDDRVVAITAAMPSGTGLDRFAKAHPDRMFDVGIAEQHAVTFAAGLACEGYKPFVAIYSTFLQRAYDQVVHDVVLQGLPVRFMMDRAGYVGADGATHCGAFDMTYLRCLPGIVIMAPSDALELRSAVHMAWSLDEGPSAVRYPRGVTEDVDLNQELSLWEMSKGRIRLQGEKVCFLAVGTKVYDCLRASDILKQERGFQASVVDMRFIKPFDKDLVGRMIENHDVIITVEEGSIGGFGSSVLEWIHQENKGYGKIIKMVTMPDEFIEQATQKEQAQCARMDEASLVAMAMDALALCVK